MTATRSTLLCAFAGGCLSNAVLFGVWRFAEGSGDAAAQQHRSQNVVELVAAASAAPSVTQPGHVIAATVADQEADVATEAAPTSPATDIESGSAPPAGSAVSDVLTRLEAAYRERVVAQAPGQGSSTQERAVAAAPVDSTIAAPEAAADVRAEPAPEAAPAVPSVALAAAVTTQPPAPPQEVAAVSVAPPVAVAPALAPPVAAAPAFAPPDAPPPAEVHYGEVNNYGEVNQNTYVTNVRQGDVYLVQMQQAAALQYLRLLGMYSGVNAGVAAPGRHVDTAARQRGTLSSGITNPDNPWGFHFARPHLVR